MMPPTLPIAVIGAGPIGLAAAAHLLERGERPLILEAGTAIGHAVRQWGYVWLFSPWRSLIDLVARRFLGSAGWQAPDPNVLPTGDALIDTYLAPLAALPCVAPHLRLATRVVAVGRKHMDKVRTVGRAGQPFILRVVTADGTAHAYEEARAVIDASGTWEHPNPLGADGLPAHGEAASATPFYIHTVSPTPTRSVAVTGQLGPQEHTAAVDAIVVATGFRPDLSILREVRVPTFLLATRYEQVRSVVATLVGDHAAAARVEIHLPPTGVCSAPPIALPPTCCGDERPTGHGGATPCCG